VAPFPKSLLAAADGRAAVRLIEIREEAQPKRKPVASAGCEKFRKDSPLPETILEGAGPLDIVD